MGKGHLKIMFAHHRWWYPTFVNGADIANHEFATKFRQRGNEVKVVGITPPGGRSRLSYRRYSAEGVPVCLVTSEFVKSLSREIKDFKPDVVVTSCPEPSCSRDDTTRMVEVIRQHKVPVVLYAHELENTLDLFEDARQHLSSIVTNSRFMSDEIKKRWPKTSPQVVYPVPDWHSIDAGGASGPFVTFFNPSPHKGIGIAHTLVTQRLKTRPFLFVEGFMDPEAHGISLIRSGNLVHARRSPDVATIYVMTRTVIVPSQWQEPFGRIALEAMYNHIPVIASATGGLLESVGEGGLLIENYSDVDRWVDALERLDDESERRRWIVAGAAHVQSFSQRKEVDTFLNILGEAASQPGPT